MNCIEKGGVLLMLSGILNIILENSTITILSFSLILFGSFLFMFGDYGELME